MAAAAVAGGGADAGGGAVAGGAGSGVKREDMLSWVCFLFFGLEKCGVKKKADLLFMRCYVR